MKKAIYLASLCIITLFPSTLLAWSEGGHYLIALMAYDRLPTAKQTELLNLLQSHPNYAKDFKVPKSMKDERQKARWLVGRAAYWPDVARSHKEYDRPTWHYELGSSLNLGNVAKLKVPDEPGPLPVGSTLETQDLYISQAIALCGSIYRDKSKPAPDRAIALCWLGHLVGDAHQPCHAGSLYAEGVFAAGDRGANSIPTFQEKNLHALWDGLFGKSYDQTSTNRRIGEILSDKELVKRGLAAIDSPEDRQIKTWLSESKAAAVDRVYSPEVIQAVSAASRIGSKVPETIKLSEEYLKSSGRVAQVRAIEAAYRLAEVWAIGL